ncbi:hypothetical protein [Pseudomonas sp. 5P_3.1_Bac2]|uniref:hypothetical protein n=1 Tax=Pseudomonas sp. 5P_3.1_Bac2 TaxID=2971617 RepID=UPI0021C7C9C2|nr:hypothetical protein [Pseudomonas sp. 5P_3.1_Bac2]MCU1718385.1 hypothetical protein [Pseudomonas sp. 5P_3.1_Bac2]
MLRVLLLSLGLLLSACVSQTPLPQQMPSWPAPLPLSLHVQRISSEATQSWWLVLQDEGGVLRASLFDPLGVPLARQQLLAGQWHNDGLLPPNAEARQLFSALLFALSEPAQLAQLYPAGNWQVLADGSRRLAPNWQVQYRSALLFSLQAGSGLHYQISPLDDDKAQ